ncbi:MAG: DNA topoisomerase IB [Beijerinckiaceae bacterium]|nr:DNA topoisomerase IB [Beijerinckiaceae bacterium]
MAKTVTAKTEAKSATRLKRTKPGDLSIRREARGKGFRYVDGEGAPVRDEATLARIRSLAIPPAYRDVRIAAAPNGHLQAVGHDEAGRVQHRYHPDWEKVREKRKLVRLGRLIAALPKLREAVACDLKGRTLTRDRALACAVALIDRCHIRVGNETYAKENGSYGASTLLKRHVTVTGSTVSLAFRGKSGKEIACETKDPVLARTITLLKELPGRRLFQHRREDGTVAVLRAAEINAYIGRCAGLPVTAKDLRMLAANAAAAELLLAGEIVASETGRKRQLADIMRAISQRLVNTPAVVRKSYVHAIVVSSYASGRLKRCFEKARARGNCSRIERTLGLLTA